MRGWPEEEEEATTCVPAVALAIAVTSISPLLSNNADALGAGASVPVAKAPAFWPRPLTIAPSVFTNDAYRSCVRTLEGTSSPPMS